MSFTPGSDAAWYELTSIRFTVGTLSAVSPVATPVRVAIHPDNCSDRPAEDALYVAYALIGTTPAASVDLEATFPDDAILRPGTNNILVQRREGDSNPRDP